MEFTDLQIIAGIKNKNSQVIEYLYTNVLPSIKQLVLKQGGSEVVAADVMQDAMLALFRNIKLNKYEKGEAKLSTYLVQLGKYIWYDKLKKAHRKRNVPLESWDQPDHIEDAQDQLEKVELHKKLHQMIGKLGNQCQQILRLFYWEKKSMVEIAQLLNQEAASVKNGKYRCMKQLRTFASNLKY